MDKQILKEFKDLNVPLKEYLNVQLELEKLALLKKLSQFAAYLFKVLVVVYFSILIIGFLLGALAVWYGRTFDNYFAGVLIAGAGLLAVTVLMIAMRKKNCIKLSPGKSFGYFIKRRRKINEYGFKKYEGR